MSNLTDTEQAMITIPYADIDASERCGCGYPKWSVLEESLGAERMAREVDNINAEAVARAEQAEAVLARVRRLSTGFIAFTKSPVRHSPDEVCERAVFVLDRVRAVLDGAVFPDEVEHADDCTGCDGPGVVPCAADRVVGDFAYRDGVAIKRVNGEPDERDEDILIGGAL